MRRLTILASSLPLLLAAFFARHDLLPANQACIAVGETSVQLATAAWQAQTNVSFTDDPARATVRVLIVDTPETADFAVADDIETASEPGCVADAATRLIGITRDHAGTTPMIYLARDGDADYRIYVNSRRMTPRDAAALIVGANGGHSRLSQAAL